MKRLWKSIIRGIILLFVLVVGILSHISCDSAPVESPENETGILRGRVILQNQLEHSNCLIYLDNFNVGLCTDSSGYFSCNISRYKRNFTGLLKIYYYVREYFPDSATVEILNGKVQYNGNSIGERGGLKIKELRQRLRIEGWTDKYIYKIGENITFTARFTNLSNEKTHIYLAGGTSSLGFVILYREDLLPLFLEVPIPNCAVGDREINPGEYYVGTVTLPVLNEATKNITPNLYIIASTINLEYIPSPLIKKLRNYYFPEWYKIHRGQSPKYDCAPNKHKFPVIKVIE